MPSTSQHHGCIVECPHAYGERIASLETKVGTLQTTLEELVREVRLTNEKLSGKVVELEKREAKYLGIAGALMFVGTALGALLSNIGGHLWKLLHQ